MVVVTKLEVVGEGILRLRGASAGSYSKPISSAVASSVSRRVRACPFAAFGPLTGEVRPRMLDRAACAARSASFLAVALAVSAAEIAALMRGIMYLTCS